MYRLTLILALALALLNGCATSNGPDATVSLAGAPPEANLRSYPEFGETLAKALHDGDRILLVHSLDMERLLHRSFDDAGLSDGEYRAVANRSQQVAQQFVDNIQREIGKKGGVTFIRIRPQEDSRLPGSRCLMRIVPEGGGVAYWDLYLDTQGDRVVVYDWFNYGTGQLASASIGGFMKLLQSLKEEDRRGELKLVRQYVASVRKQQYERALELYKRLPEPIRQDPLVLISRVQVSMAVSEGAYRAALADLARLRGDDDSFALLLLDYYLYSGQYAQGHRALEMVAARTGGDAGIEAMHAALALEAGSYQEAIGYARTGVSLDPDYEQSYWVLLEALAQTGYYDDAVLVLQILQDGFYYEFDADQLAALDGFEAFGQSRAFEGWRTSLH
jgi:tetratricopeptide (TPR) repeat protein